MYSDHTLTAFLGPCLTEQAASSRLDIPVDELGRYAAAGTVIRALTPDGTALYPEWAFEGDEVRLGVLHAGAFAGDLGDPTGLTFAIWMLCPTPALEGKSPVQWIDRERPEDEGRLEAWAALTARTYRARRSTETGLPVVHLICDANALHGVYTSAKHAEVDAAALRRNGDLDAEADVDPVFRNVKVRAAPQFPVV